MQETSFSPLNPFCSIASRRTSNMQLLRKIVLSLALLSAAPVVGDQPAVQERPGNVPDRVSPVVPGRHAPEWVSAELIVRDGELQRELFAPEELPIVEMHLESGRQALSNYRTAPADHRPADPCVYVATSDHRVPPPARTIKDLAASSTGIYLGTVLAERPGLLRGVPRALLRVKLERVLKHEVPGPPPQTLLMAYPEVRMEVGEVCLAARSPRHPARPEVGRQILVFSAAEVPLLGNAILTPADEEIFSTLPDGRASLPVHLGDLLSPAGEPLALDFVVEATEGALDATGKGAA
jgi:hypothetical protein